MRCNYLPIWFICSCRDRPSIHFTLEEPNSHFDLKCNFQQSWSQQFGLNTAQACAGRTKEGWEGESTERWGRAQEAALPQHHPPSMKCRKQLGLPACCVHSLTSGQAHHHLCPTPALTSAHMTPALKASWGFTDINQVIQKYSRERFQVRARKLRNSGAEGPHSVK